MISDSPQTFWKVSERLAQFILSENWYWKDSGMPLNAKELKDGGDFSILISWTKRAARFAGECPNDVWRSAPPMRTHMDKTHTLFPKLLFLTPTCAFIVSCAYNAALALRANFGFMIHFRIYATCQFKVKSNVSVCDCVCVGVGGKS